MTQSFTVKNKHAFVSLDFCLEKKDIKYVGVFFIQHINRVPYKTFRSASNIAYVWLPLNAASRPNFS